MSATFFYTFADRETFDDVGRWQADPADPRFRRIALGPAPIGFRPGWTYRPSGIWTVCRPDGVTLTEQGWKLHVAVTPESFERVLAVVSEICFGERVPFKFLTRREYAWLMNAKYAPRNVSGKGITIYPADDEQSVALARRLVDVLRAEQGPRILSDLQVDGSVVHARYGSFVRRYCRDADGKVAFGLRGPDGQLMPDSRAVPFRPPSWVTVPDYFAPRPPDTGDPAGLPPYRVDKTLHFSNGGGVYVATHLPTGRAVVLKEARPFAAYDLAGDDAVTRARREFALLGELSGLPGLTAVEEQFTWQSHVFTAMEYVSGNTLQEWCATHHPFLLRDDPTRPPTAAEVATFRSRVTDLVGQVRRTVEEIWAKGYAVGDLHPANVMVTEGLTTKLLDLETCVGIDQERVLGGTPGFSRADRSGRDGDEYGLAMLELSCYVPLTPLVGLDEGKLHHLAGVARDRFGLPVEWAERILRTCAGDAAAARAGAEATAESGHLPGRLGFPAWAGEVVAGFRSGMDVHRTDRLFPGDTTGFGAPAVALGTGAAGVLWSLVGTADLTEPDLAGRIADWIVRHGRVTVDRPECGLFDSELGVAAVLRAAGRPADAAWFADAGLAKDRTGCGMGLYNGVAGIYLAVAHLAAGPDPLAPESEARRIGGRLVDRARRLRDRLTAAGSTPIGMHGLMHGLSGVALAVHRYARLAGDDETVRLARDLMDLELAGFVRCSDGSYQLNEEGRRTLSYLETGSCGTALALAELVEDGDWEPAGGITVPDLIRAIGPEVMFQSGLFRGRAGFLAGGHHLHRMGYDGGAVVAERHVGNLGLHELRPVPGRLWYPGSGNLRLSADLRTGGAGVLTAIAFATGRRDHWLPAVF